MDKIASPQELQSVLQSILEYSKGPRPSREKLASDLRALADQVDLPHSRTAGSVESDAKPIAKDATSELVYHGVNAVNKYITETAGLMGMPNNDKRKLNAIITRAAEPVIYDYVKKWLAFSRA